MAKRKKKQKQKPTKTLRKELITLAKTVAKTRDKYTCQKCGRSKEQGYKIDGSHVVGVAAGGTKLACETVNIKALCSSCHRNWWHQDTVTAGKWFVKNWPDRWEHIEIMRVVYQAESGSIPRSWYENRLIELTEELELL